MGTIKRSIRIALAMAVAGIVLGSSVFGQEGDEVRSLRERERRVRTRIGMLKKEQELLLFQRTLAAADSKYLILDLRTGKGMLKYRGRILRNFDCPLAGKRLTGAVPKRIVTLTEKMDGSPRTRQLVFNDPLVIIQSKHISTGKAKSKQGLRIVLGKKDLGAIFFALEKGSLAYIIN
jgi:hypothetical protein